MSNGGDRAEYGRLKNHKNHSLSFYYITWEIVPDEGSMKTVPDFGSASEKTNRYSSMASLNGEQAKRTLGGVRRIGEETERLEFERVRPCFREEYLNQSGARRPAGKVAGLE